MTQKQQDLKEIKLLTERFETEFRHLGLKVYTDHDGVECKNKFKDYLGYGANSIFTIDVPVKFKTTKWQRNPHSPMIWVDTSINPNGITGANDIGRTYDIQFCFRCDVRDKHKHYWGNDFDLVKFYSYGRSIDEIIREFKNFTLSNKFTDLF